MTKQLKDALAKNEADLTAEEKTLIQNSVAELDEAAKTKFAKTIAEIGGDDDDDDEKGLTEKELKELLDKGVGSSIEDKVKSIENTLIAKFFSGVGAARAKVLEEGDQRNEKTKKADEKTREFMKALLSKDSVKLKAITTGTGTTPPDDSQAGYLIPQELSTEIYRIAETQYGLARREMKYMPFSGPGNERIIPVVGTGVSIFINGEKAKKQSTQPKFTRVIQSLKELAAIVPFTEQILEDSAINLTTLVAQLFAEAIAKFEDEQFLAGDGTGGGWTGVLNNTSVQVVHQITAGADNVHTDDLLNMQDEVPTSALPGSKYYLNRKALTIVRKLKDLNGNYIYQRPSDKLPGMIFDYPYELSDAMPMPSAVAVGDPWIIFGNLNMSCVLGDKGGQMRMKLLTEATITDTDGQTTINLAEQDMVALRVAERVGFNLVLPQAICVLKSDEESGS
jgi:HK97 family phage major capsid protein